MIATEMVIDNFAGGGGASQGIQEAIGRPVDVAINHDREAIAMHVANHPLTKHLTTDVFDVDPLEVTQGRPVALGWFSPDCTHFSKAKGGQPRKKEIRGLAWVVVDWAKAVHPRVIMLENVEEFRTWGPLDEDGYPIKDKKGETFEEWLAALRSLGYVVEWRELRACDYGAPTIRKRLFIVARCDGQPVQWPKQTHGKNGFAFLPYRTAAECIDWSLDCPSIFERKKPLAEATLRRIATGIRRYVIEAEQPFIVSLTHQGGDDRAYGVGQPFLTVTGAHRGEQALVMPYLAGVGGRMGDSPARPVNAPYHTVTAKADTVIAMPYLTKFQENSIGQEVREPLDTVMAGAPRFGLVAPVLVQTGYGEAPGQSPRALDIEKPLGTVVGGGAKHALAAAFITKYYETNVGSPMLAPLPTVTSGGQHLAEVRAFLVKYYGNDKEGQGVRDPLHTVTSKERFALGVVTLAGEPYQIVDIGMRMLTPRELFNAQGFPGDYVIDPELDGKKLTKTAQIRMCGNSVCPPAARAIVEANVGRLDTQHAWSGIEAVGS